MSVKTLVLLAKSPTRISQSNARIGWYFSSTVIWSPVTRERVMSDGSC